MGGRGFQRQSREYRTVCKFLKTVTYLLQGRFVGVCMHFTVHKLYRMGQ